MSAIESAGMTSILLPEYLKRVILFSTEFAQENMPEGQSTLGNASQNPKMKNITTAQ